MVNNTTDVANITLMSIMLKYTEKSHLCTLFTLVHVVYAYARSKITILKLTRITNIYKLSATFALLLQRMLPLLLLLLTVADVANASDIAVAS